MISGMAIKAVLLDIEGTTTSISFVKDVLFTYARNNVAKYVDMHWGEEHLTNVVQALKEQAEDDVRSGMTGVVQIPSLNCSKDEVCKAVVANVLWQIGADRKTKALKDLQGHMWKNAYESGEIKSHVYDDVIVALKAWKQQGLSIYIYSSGSVQAQKLLFQHTTHGDLTNFLSGYFDTNVGPKISPQSYSTIASTISLNPEKILFLTDIVKEAEAAKTAGLHVAILERDGNAPLRDEDKKQFRCAKNFDEVCRLPVLSQVVVN